MAADFIPLNRSLTMGNNLVRQAELLREFRELTDKLNDNVNHMVDGETRTVLIARTGVDISQAPDLATLVGYMNNIFNTNTTVAGADRLSQIDEFVARIAGQ